YRLFTSALNRLLKRGWSEQDWARAAERSESALLGDKITRSTFERTYVHACQSMVADGVVDDDEIRFLHKVESAVGTVTPVMHSSKSDAFRGLVFAAATDPEFDEADEGILDELRDQLGLDAEALGAGTTLRERLKRLRAIRSGELPVVRPSVPIQKSETCYYEGVGRFLKEKQLQSFQRDGVRYKVRGLAIDKEGLLLITNKRTLLVHSGTSSVRHDKVFDVEVDLDENMVSITKDGSQTPTLITTPDALEAGALIARLSGA
ncbi:MAG: hypothetical protein O2992_15995, partial [Gemmatimonadetes bacterium]|nr:hypothetical protein [Gemmatimonadota bacterium]